MSPEEEYEEEIKWVLQKIKKALLTAGPDVRVDFNASRLTNSDPDSPSLDVIYNHIKSLERRAVLRIIERYDGDGYDVYGYSLDAGAGVTGYGFIVDRQKFDALYEKYFKPHLPESVKSFNFENEKQNIAAIDSADEYKIIADKWLNIKQILDALFKLLSPIDTSEVQTVTLNPRYLPLEQGRLFTSVLSDMIKAGAIGGTHKINPPVVVTSAMATSLTSGKYIPLNVAVFKAYRKKVADLVAWIETDQAKFSKSDNALAKENEKHEGDTEADEEEDEEDDVFSYDGGISTSYENNDMELFILKKILLEHKQRGDGGFDAKELSFNNNSLEDICRVINRLMEDKILYLSANTSPERTDDEEGIEDKRGFINWSVVEKFDKNPKDTEGDCVIFDTEVTDEIKLKGHIDLAVEEFMNDIVYSPLGRSMEITALDQIIAKIESEPDKEKKSAMAEMLLPSKITYPYRKQRGIVIDEITKDPQKNEALISLDNYPDKKVDLLKTLLALEKENILRIKELRSNPVYDEKGNFVGKWSAKDQPMARVHILKDVEVNTNVSAEKSLAIRGEIPKFDTTTGDVIIGGTPCHIADAGDLQYHVCNELLSIGKGYELGKWLTQTVLQDSYARFGVVAEQAGAGSVKELFKSERWLRDAVSAINVKTTNAYGINLLGYKKSQVRVTIELFK